MRPIIYMVLSGVVMAGAVMKRAHAQPGDASAVAEQLFNDARALGKANRWAEACPKFEASLSAEPALGTQLNLAECYKHIGKLARAWGLFCEVIAQATTAGDVERRDYARKQADALEPRLPRLAISVPQNPPAGLVVAQDRAPVDLETLDVAHYVDPGTHLITASAPGFEMFMQTVTLVEGRIETIAIPALAAVPVRARKYAAFAASAIGVASIGIGLLFGAKADSAYQDAKELCGSTLACSADNYSRGRQLISDTRSAATISTVLITAGGAAVLTGAIAVMWRRSSVRTTAQLVPMTSDRGGGMAVTGRF